MSSLSSVVRPFRWLWRQWGRFCDALLGAAFGTTDSEWWDD